MAFSCNELQKSKGVATDGSRASGGTDHRQVRLMPFSAQPGFIGFYHISYGAGHPRVRTDSSHLLPVAGPRSQFFVVTPLQKTTSFRHSSHVAQSNVWPFPGIGQGAADAVLLGQVQPVEQHLENVSPCHMGSSVFSQVVTS